MKRVECRTLYGGTRLVPIDDLIVRPSVYAIVIHDGSVLLLKSHATGKWMQPGGGIDKGETVEEALQREMLEETGIGVEIGEFAHFQPDFFYYDPLDMAMQGYLFFYHCTPQSLDLKPPDPDEEGVPEWVKISDLTAEDFESHGEVMMRLILAGQKHDAD